MINFKKGPALSLHQVNYLGKAKANEGIVAGMVVTIDANGEAVKPTIVDWDGSGSANDKDMLLGFAINNQSSGDVIESGIIGVYALDGSSVVETDQTEHTINTTNYPTGTLLGIKTGTGQVCTVTNTFAGPIIGQVEGIRSIPGKENQYTNVTLTDPVTGGTRTRSFSYQPATVAVLAIKLKS